MERVERFYILDALLILIPFLLISTIRKVKAEDGSRIHKRTQSASRFLCSAVHQWRSFNHSGSVNPLLGQSKSIRSLTMPTLNIPSKLSLERKVRARKSLLVVCPAASRRSAAARMASNSCCCCGVTNAITDCGMTENECTLFVKFSFTAGQ